MFQSWESGFLTGSFIISPPHHRAPLHEGMFLKSIVSAKGGVVPGVRAPAVAKQEVLLLPM